MDNCHCLKPVFNPRGDHDTCESCGMWYNQSLWDKDPRVTAAKKNVATLVEAIMSFQNPKK